jgi:hypothetical protein
MRSITTIFISILIIVVFQGISSAQPGSDKPGSGANQVQIDGNTAPDNIIDDSKQAPEIDILSIRYKNSVIVPIDFSEGLPLNGLVLDTEKEIPAPDGYTFLNVMFKIKNLEIDNLSIDDIVIADPEDNKDIPTIFVDATWNVTIQAFMTRSYYHSSPDGTISCTFVIRKKFSDEELMLSIAKYNLKHVIPRVFEYKKSENVSILTFDGKSNVPSSDDNSGKIQDTAAGKPVSQ